MKMIKSVFIFIDNEKYKFDFLLVNQLNKYR